MKANPARGGHRFAGEAIVDREQSVLTRAPAVRLTFLLGVFAAVGRWEIASPRHAPTVSLPLRWASKRGP
jgi:hypothetical protein